MIPEKNVSKEVMSWMHMGSYESSIDAQKLDANRIEIKKCTLLRCGYTFIDVSNHYWQFHSNSIEPNVMKSSKGNTVTESQNSNANHFGSNIEIDDEPANNTKSEMIHEVLSTQQAKNSSHKAPEVETDEEPVPASEYRPENLDKDNVPVNVNDDEHMYATRHELDTSNDDEKD